MTHFVFMHDAGMGLTLEGVHRYPIMGILLSLAWCFDGVTLKVAHRNWKAR